MSTPILQLENVTKVFGNGVSQITAVDDVSFDVIQGECLAIVGESGSGKSTVANMLLGIYPPSSGQLFFKGNTLPDHRNLEHRRAIQLVQQNPLSSLNPKRTIGASLKLALDVHKIGEKNSRRERIGELLKEVGLSAKLATRSPTALSGGQRQRVAIARALACESEVVILDEPTSALDVLVQARVLKLLSELRKQRNLSFVFITHDLSVVRNIADRIAIFENGKLVEIGTNKAIFTKPHRAYTRDLISAVPVVSQSEIDLRKKLSTLKGEHNA